MALTGSLTAAPESRFSRRQRFTQRTKKVCAVSREKSFRADTKYPTRSSAARGRIGAAGNSRSE
jgi:hypothetical protein